MNTRKLLNQRRKTHLKKGGAENNTIILERPAMQYNKNIERNQHLSNKMGRVAIQRLDALEKQAPVSVRKVKDDFFQVSNNMYKLAKAIKSVSNITSKSIANNNNKRKTNNKSKVNLTEQKEAIDQLKGDFFEVSTRLVTLADSIKEAEKTLPGITGVNKGTNRSNYIRRNSNK